MSSPLPFTKRERILIIPFPILLLLGGFFVGAAFLLIPKEEELLNRFLEDNNAARAHDLVTNAKGQEIIDEAAALIKAIRDKVGLGAKEEVSLASAVDPNETLRTFLGDGTCRPGDVTLPDLVFAVRSAETPGAEDLLEQLRIASAEKTLEAGDWNTVTSAIAEKALGEGNPSMAADLLLAACQSEGKTTDWDRVRLAVQSCRWSERTEEAADLLSQFETSEIPEDIVNLQIKLLQEIGRNGEAFTAVTRYIGTLDENVLVPEGIMESAEQTGLYSGQQTALLPIYRRHLAATKFGQMDWDDFLAAADAGTLGEDPSYIRYASTFAKICEWNQLPDEGFEHYRKLALLNDSRATSRCLALYLGLARQIDMEEILIGPASSFGEKSEIRRLHLQLMGGNGHYETAVPAYRDWLAKNPDDVDAWLELALLLDEIGDFDQSLEVCKSALLIHQKHIRLRAHTARLLQSLGRYEDSLAMLTELAPEEHDATTREDYELLAEAVGSWEDLNKAIRLSIQAADKPKMELFEALARSSELMGDVDGEIKALEDGLKVHPASRTLALNLASTLIDLGEIEAAVAALTSDELKGELAAVCLLIDIGGRVENPNLIYSHLGSDAHHRYNLPASSLLALSEIYQLMGKNEAAAEIFEGMPMEPPQWEMIAELRFNQRRFEDARHYQELVTNGSTDHAAWMFLGEILQEIGDAAGAETAFKKSLSLLRSRIIGEAGSVARK